MTQTDIDNGRLIVRGRRRAGEAGRVRDRPDRPVDRARRRLSARQLRRRHGNRRADRSVPRVQLQLEIDGVPSGGFSEVERPDRRRRRRRLPRGHRLQLNVRKLPRPAQVREHHAQARLHAGQVAVGVVRATSSTASADRRNVTIVLLNEERKAVLRWHVENAWINKIEGPASRPRQRGRDGVPRARPRRA